MQIRNFHRVEVPGERPHFEAEVVEGDFRATVHNRFGSWLAELPDGTTREVLRPLAERLQAKLPSELRKARKPVRLSAEERRRGFERKRAEA